MSCPAFPRAAAIGTWNAICRRDTTKGCGCPNCATARFASRMRNTVGHLGQRSTATPFGQITIGCDPICVKTHKLYQQSLKLQIQTFTNTNRRNDAFYVMFQFLHCVPILLFTVSPHNQSFLTKFRNKSLINTSLSADIWVSKYFLQNRKYFIDPLREIQLSYSSSTQRSFTHKNEAK